MHLHWQLQQKEDKKWKVFWVGRSAKHDKSRYKEGTAPDGKW